MAKAKKTVDVFDSTAKKRLNTIFEELEGIDDLSDFQRNWYQSACRKFKELDETGGSGSKWMNLLTDLENLLRDVKTNEDEDGNGEVYPDSEWEQRIAAAFLKIDEVRKDTPPLKKTALDWCQFLQEQFTSFKNKGASRDLWEVLAEQVEEFLTDLQSLHAEAKSGPSYTLNEPVNEEGYIDPLSTASEETVSLINAVFGKGAAEMFEGCVEQVTITRNGRDVTTLSGEQFDRAAKKLTNAEKEANAFPVPADKHFDDEDADYIDANDLREIATKLIEGDEKQFWHLKEISIRYAWKRKGGRFFGKCESVTGSKEFLAGGKYNFLIWLAADNVRDSKLSREQVTALVCHEICHIAWKDNRVRLVTHDFEDFYYVVRKYGAILPDLELARDAFKDHQPSLFE